MVFTLGLVQEPITDMVRMRTQNLKTTLQLS